MNTQTSVFNLNATLLKLKHYLPAQAPLKDFVHHNTLHAFQHKPFHTALNEASELFGYKNYFQIEEFRKLYKETKINPHILERIIADKKGVSEVLFWKKKLLFQEYNSEQNPRIGCLKKQWKSRGEINLNKITHPILFRMISGYLDQGISMLHFPIKENGFLTSLKALNENSYSDLFKTEKAKGLLKNEQTTIVDLLKIVVGDEDLCERYLFDLAFAHPGWSGMIAVLEDNPNSLLDKRKVSLADFIFFELLLEIDALETKLGANWSPLALIIKDKPTALFAPVETSELSEVLAIWQEAFEWTYYDEVLCGLKNTKPKESQSNQASFQALFCIDDRECSIRRYLEEVDNTCETFATPGHFNIVANFQPEHSKFYTKICPAPLTPQHLIRERQAKKTKNLDLHFAQHSHSLLRGWLLSTTLGFWSAIKLFTHLFKPTYGAAAVSSFNHMGKNGELLLETKHPENNADGLQLGFTIDEMVERMETLLKSISLTNNFAKLVYFVGHGASSLNNTYYAGYDCGACCGRPGSVNARSAAIMCNHPEVRKLLKEKGIDIPATTQFVGGLHDTTRDEVEFYDEKKLSAANTSAHNEYKNLFEKALSLDAKERSRRFALTKTKLTAKEVHKKVKERSVSLFEPRPEYNHATNCLCIVSKRDLLNNLFLDRRAFMNSYDYSTDPNGEYLAPILNAATPVCGGINLEYYFSRVDNEKLGAGSKLPHNVIGLLGVANGSDGDLRPGLPFQMVEIHDPLRLLMVVEHYPEVVLNTIKANPATYEWYKNEWVNLCLIHPENREVYRFKNGEFIHYETINKRTETTNNLMGIIELNQENLPVYLTNN